MFSKRLLRSVPITSAWRLRQPQSPSSRPPSRIRLSRSTAGEPAVRFGTIVGEGDLIVNGEVITQTDIDQRLALMSIANNADDRRSDRLRQQILSNLIDETLQIQAAKAGEITDADIDKTVARGCRRQQRRPIRWPPISSRVARR